MKYNIIPLADRLIVKPIVEEAERELIIPDHAKEKPQKGEVIAVGEGKEGKPLLAKPGDTVLYRRESGLPLPGTDGWLMMKEGIDTIAILEPIAD